MNKKNAKLSLINAATRKDKKQGKKAVKFYLWTRF